MRVGGWSPRAVYSRSSSSFSNTPAPGTNPVEGGNTQRGDWSGGRPVVSTPAAFRARWGRSDRRGMGEDMKGSNLPRPKAALHSAESS